MKRKVQIVILSQNHETKDLEALVFKTNKERGSFWQNVTGSVEDNESFDDAAVRELIEETGVDPTHIKQHIFDMESEFFFIDRKERRAQEKVYYYLGPKWDIKICEEHIDFKWLSAQGIHRDLYKYESNYQALTKALEKISL